MVSKGSFTALSSQSSYYTNDSPPAAGQRCMALSVMITVGDSASWVSDLVDRARSLKVGNGMHEQTEMCVDFVPVSCTSD